MRSGALSLVAEVPISQSEYEQKVRDTPGDYRRLKRELHAAAKAGKLVAEGKGDSLEFELGALYDWLGKPVEARPDWGWRYAAVPDAEYEQYRWRREVERALADEQHRPSHPARFLRAVAGRSVVEPDLQPLDEATRAFAQKVKLGIEEHWPVLLALEQVEQSARDAGLKPDG